jgi:PAS domain S-box-containing protein
MNSILSSRARTVPGMVAPPLPADEAQRLAALHRLALLDTPPAESFDRITRLASKALGVPILLVSLVDAERQWFKSCVGLDATQTSRDVSFCGHAVYARRPLIVPDATRDARFAGNPLVTGPPHVRAYLGVPIFSVERQPVGTLCAIDVLPREFSDEEIATMRDFADILEEMINARDLAVQADALLRYATKRERLFRENFEGSAGGMMHASLTGRVHRVNQRACELLGSSRVEVLGISLFKLIHPDDALRHAAVWERLLAGEITEYRLVVRMLVKGGEWLPVILSVTRAEDPGAGREHVMASFEAISAAERSAMDPEAAVVC